MTNNKKIVLAFSGGLDTTFCAVWLQQQGYEVHALTVQTGGFSDTELKQIEARATMLGVASFAVAHLTETYYEQCIRFLIYGNVLKNGTYPLSVSAERICQAIAVAKHVQAIGAVAVAHGSTGAGNDQVRFDMVFQSLIPDAEIITPIRDLRLSRDAEIEFLRAQNIDLDFTKSAYSINKGLWGTSVGGRETLHSRQPLPESAWPTPVTKTEPESIELHFEQGELKGINKQVFTHPAQAIAALQEMAQPMGIGRDIHVGDTIIGIKGRVGFEAAAPVIIIKAHHLLEKHTLTKWQLYWKEQLATWYGNWLHEGHLLDPTMRHIEGFLTDTQKTVTGTVFCTLYPYRFTLDGIESPHDLMSQRFGTYGEMNNTWNGDDVRGFAKIFGNQTAIFNKINGVNYESSND